MLLLLYFKELVLPAWIGFRDRPNRPLSHLSAPSR